MSTTKTFFHGDQVRVPGWAQPATVIESLPADPGVGRPEAKVKVRGLVTGRESGWLEARKVTLA